MCINEKQMRLQQAPCAGRKHITGAWKMQIREKQKTHLCFFFVLPFNHTNYFTVKGHDYSSV